MECERRDIEPELHQIALLGRDAEDSGALVDEVRTALSARGLTSPGERQVLVRAWYDVNPTFAQLLGIRDAAAWIVALIVFGVAALGILNTMLMSVFERTRELGVLRHQQRASLHQVLREYQLLGGILVRFVQDEAIRLALTPPPEECITVVSRRSALSTGSSAPAASKAAATKAALRSSACQRGLTTRRYSSKSQSRKAPR